MVIDRSLAASLYSNLFDWLKFYTPGGRCNKTRLKKYQKEVWGPIIEITKQIQSKDEKSKDEIRFLQLTNYGGKLYRVQNYWPMAKGLICESFAYQSWSKNLEAVSKVPLSASDVLLIVTMSKNAIDIFGLLLFLFEQYKSDGGFDLGEKNPRNLIRYEKEEEVAFSMTLPDILTVCSVKKERLLCWETEGILISKEKWARKDFT